MQWSKIKVHLFWKFRLPLKFLKICPYMYQGIQRDVQVYLYKGNLFHLCNKPFPSHLPRHSHMLCLLNKMPQPPLIGDAACLCLATFPNSSMFFLFSTWHHGQFPSRKRQSHPVLHLAVSQPASEHREKSTTASPCSARTSAEQLLLLAAKRFSSGLCWQQQQQLQS